ANGLQMRRIESPVVRRLAMVEQPRAVELIKVPDALIGLLWPEVVPSNAERLPLHLFSSGLCQLRPQLHSIRLPPPAAPLQPGLAEGGLAACALPAVLSLMAKIEIELIGIPPKLNVLTRE